VSSSRFANDDKRAIATQYEQVLRAPGGWGSHNF